MGSVASYAHKAGCVPTEGTKCHAKVPACATSHLQAGILCKDVGKTLELFFDGCVIGAGRGSRLRGKVAHQYKGARYCLQALKSCNPYKSLAAHVTRGATRLNGAATPCNTVTY